MERREQNEEIRSLLQDAEIALKVLCAKYGYNDDKTFKDWSEWVEARRVHTAIRSARLAFTSTQGPA